MYNKNLGITISASCEEFSEAFSWGVKYPPGGSYHGIHYPEHERGSNNIVLDTDVIFGDIPERLDQRAILWIFKNESPIRMSLQLKRPNSGSYVGHGGIWGHELLMISPGRLGTEGYSWRIALNPHDKSYAALTDLEKASAFVRVAAFAIDYTLGF